MAGLDPQVKRKISFRQSQTILRNLKHHNFITCPQDIILFGRKTDGQGHFANLSDCVSSIPTNSTTQIWPLILTSMGSGMKSNRHGSLTTGEGSLLKSLSSGQPLSAPLLSGRGSVFQPASHRRFTPEPSRSQSTNRSVTQRYS